MLMYEYLASIVNSQLGGAQSCQQPDNISFDEIADIAIRNHLSYLIFSELLKSNSFSESQVEYMRSHVKRSVFTTLIQSNELMRMEAIFEERRVKCMPMKGAVLKLIYPRPELREMSDIDVLIAPDCIEEAGKALIDIGYSLSHSVKHHDVYSKGPIMTIEAHKSLYDKTVDNAQYEYFTGFDRARLCNGAKYIYEYSLEDFFVYMIAHAAKHFYAMGCGIRNLIDIYVYLSKYNDVLDRNYVETELKRCGIADFAYHMEKLAFDWLSGKKLDEFYQSLFQYMLDSGIYGKDENGIWNKFCDEKKDKISRLELKMWYYFPPLYYMSDYYPWLEDKHFLLPLAWMIRLFRGMFMHKGVQKREMVNRIRPDEIMTYKRIYQTVNLQFSKK